MQIHPSQSRRRAAVMGEAALVLPVYFFMLIGMVYSGLSVFRYQQVAEVAREGARWASVHGSIYATAHNSGVATTVSSVYTNAMKSAGVSLDRSKVTVTGSGCTTPPLTFKVIWNNNQRPGMYNSGSASSPVISPSTVTVTVSYVLFSGATVTSTAQMPMVY